MNDNVKTILEKVTSGRWFMTVCAGITFVWCAVKGLIDSPAVTAIISSVITAYFHRTDRTPKDKNQQQ